MIRNSSVTTIRRNADYKTAKHRTKSLGRLYRHLLKKSKRRAVRYGIVSANMVLLVAVAMFVITDYSKTGGEGSSIQPLAGAAEESVNPLDTLSSADVAVHVARLTKLDEATAVVNKADTVSSQQAVTPADDQVIAKPQVISTDLKSRKDIQRYTVQAGDTVSSIARKFGVTSDTIRLSNGLSSETLAPGVELLISPINGMVYKVQAGDTIDSISSRYRADKEKLIAFNDAELTGRFKAGELIVIPDASQPIQTTSFGSNGNGFGSSFSGYGYQASYGGNGYDYGWCTWHAANRRNASGNPIPNNLGNAISWLTLAQSAGLSTGSDPRAGAVLYHTNLGGLGHVAYVEKVNANGSLLVSDMNYPLWGTVTYRTVSPGEVSSYRFIY
jgi:surface antigen